MRDFEDINFQYIFGKPVLFFSCLVFGGNTAQSRKD
jgi:hypothetical protein